MKRLLHSVVLRDERDVVNARQRARFISGLLGFDHPDQIRIATAVSEIARNAFRYARDGAVAFSVDTDAGKFWTRVTDHGSGIPHLETVLSGSYRSTTGMGKGILGTKRLMDEFVIDSTGLGTSVEFAKSLPLHGATLDEADMQRLVFQINHQHPVSPVEELQVQNRELLRTFNELRERKDELDRINSELQDTNRGVVALYAELDERADYLRRASELKSSFLSNMSHEFRTPLNSMLALTRMLLDRMDGDLTPEQEQQIRFIQKSAKELAEMVDDLLDLAKVEAGRLEIKAKSFAIEDMFGALRGMLKPLLAESSLTLSFEVEPGLPLLYTDEQKVSQILRNFISNAIKFTPSGEVVVFARPHGDTVEIAVRDTGIGITESDLPLIFEEFSQVDSSVQRKVKGTGLGLPLSKKFAEMLGGSVTVTSIVGAGSTFSLKVPVNLPGVSPAVEVSLLRIEPDKKFVLIVEDNVETALTYSRYLDSAGFQSQTVGTVAGAEAVLDQVRPSAIILDVMLSAESTWDYLRRLKASPNPIPVLVMSSTDDVHRIYGAGADAYLSKPFVPEDMIRRIHEITHEKPRARILIVDDNEVSRYLLRSFIPESLYEVFEARDGREGIRLARDLAPDLIFLDFFMPDLNGREVLRNLRGLPELERTPVVLHSTKVLDSEEVDFFARQAVPVFPKQSLTLLDAVARLRDLIEQQIARAQCEEPS